MSASFLANSPLPGLLPRSLPLAPPGLWWHQHQGEGCVGHSGLGWGPKKNALRQTLWAMTTRRSGTGWTVS